MLKIKRLRYSVTVLIILSPPFNTDQITLIVGGAGVNLNQREYVT